MSVSRRSSRTARSNKTLRRNKNVSLEEEPVEEESKENVEPIRRYSSRPKKQRTIFTPVSKNRNMDMNPTPFTRVISDTKSSTNANRRSSRSARS